MEVLFRVISFRETYGLPGGRSVTGWWSKDVAHTLNLLKDIVRTVYDHEHGLPWEFELLVLTIPQEKATIRPDGPRTGPKDHRYDGSEVFVATCDGDVTVHGWKEFARRHGEDPDSWV